MLRAVEGDAPETAWLHAFVQGRATSEAVASGRSGPDEIAWAHLDTFVWRPSAKPGRPKGGEALGLRAAWQMLWSRYGN